MNDVYHTLLQNRPQENELLTTKTLRLEDNIEDLKSKLSSALAEKDRLVQVLYRDFQAHYVTA